MKKIKLGYYNVDNLGDALSPQLFEELSGMQVQFKCFGLTYKRKIWIIIAGILKLNFEEIKSIIFPWEKVYSGIGSIISWSDKNSIIWGSGFMHNSEKFKGGKILAVRGKLTKQKLIDDGFSTSNILGDPALLLPLWIKPNVPKKHKIGIIPHWTEVDYFSEKFGENYFIIDFRTKNINKIIEEILSCEHILSTSLHGIIISQAYSIPTLWIQKGYIDTDGFKFYDYFSSVNIPQYNGFKDIDKILSSEEEWETLFNKNTNKILINNSIKDIQLNLLKTFPFKLKNKYQKFINEN